jgi:predicted nucleotidyltransferase
MNRLEAALRRVALDLRRGGRAFALVGGFAVSARAEPRFTRDLDFAVAVADDREAEALVTRLLASGYAPLAQVEQEAAGRLATMRLLVPGEDRAGVVLDLLFASSGIEDEVVAAAAEVEILPGLELPVAQVPHLMALKVLARGPARPQDDADLQALLRVASPKDLTAARATLRTIAARGFARGKALERELDEVLQALRPRP